MPNYKKIGQNLLDMAGVTIDGDKSYDMQIKNQEVFKRVITEGTLGLGEAYMDGWWNVPRLDEFFTRVLSVDLDKKIMNNKKLIMDVVLAKIINVQSKKRARVVGKQHYDIGNDLYRTMLDKRMVYTCGYWEDGVENLDQAQEAKLDLICRKLGLKAGDRILDIGCGWGSFLKFAAEKYGIKGVGVTISKEQQKLAQKMCQGLDIEIRLQDYRDVDEKFHHIVSLGMIEHVGYKNYKEYMKMVHKCLKDDGLFMLHTIGGNKSVKSTDSWIAKYIFPNSMLPSIKQLSSAFEKLFVMEDWHNFSINYDKTLMAWHDNFNTHWDKIKDQYDERFKRMWEYYLLSCAGTFRSRKSQLWQIVLSKKGVKEGYKSLR